MHQALDYFSESFAQARQKFLHACHEKGHEVKTIVHPTAGPDNEELAIDSIYVGERSASRLLVIISGVHGPELMTGSGCQVGFISESLFDNLDQNTAVLFVHAANPWGAAYLRRNNEDNVDLCRNFVDFDNPPEHNQDYDNIKAWLPYAFAPGSEGDAARQAIEDYKKEHGEDAFGRGFMAGQYHDSSGVSFGGEGAVWSHKVLKQLALEYGEQAKKICVLDIHSGLGPYGYCTTVCLQVGAALQRAKKAYGPWVLAPNDPEVVSDGKAPDVSGHTTELFERHFPDAEVTLVVMEYGVKSYEVTAEILMREHRLTHDHSQPERELQQSRQDLLAAFYPQDPYWRREVWNHSLLTIEQSLQLLAEEGS